MKKNAAPPGNKAQKALFDACLHGSPELIAQAIAGGADPLLSHPDHGCTPLIFAAYQNQPECVRALLAFSNAQDPCANSEDALMTAAFWGHAACIRELLPSSNPKAQNKRGMTALMISIDREHFDCAKELAPHSDLSQTDEYLRTALHFATSSRNPEFARLLIAGSDTQARDAFGRTPLMSAAYYGSTACAEILLPLSEDEPGPRGKTAADLADERLRPELASLIRGHFRSRAELATISDSAPLPADRRHKPKL